MRGGVSPDPRCCLYPTRGFCDFSQAAPSYVTTSLPSVASISSVGSAKLGKKIVCTKFLAKFCTYLTFEPNALGINATIFGLTVKTRTGFPGVVEMVAVSPTFI